MDELTSEALAERLRKAREALGFTQAAVADYLGLPRSAITQIEAAQRQVSGFELERLARLYGRRVDDFFQPEFEPAVEVGALFRSQLGSEPTPALLDTVGRFSELGQRLSDLEDALGIAGSAVELQLPPGVRAAQSTMHAVRQGQRAALEERRRLGLGDQPLADLPELLESHGVRVFFADLPEGVDGFTLQDVEIRPFIVVTQGASPRRTRFNLAHEYGHVVMDRNVRGNLTCKENRSALPEVRANAFAAAFLMPDSGVEQFLAGLGKPRRRSTATILVEESAKTVRNTKSREETSPQAMHVVQVAAHFGVSWEAALYRLASLDYLNTEERGALHAELTVRGKAMERILDDGRPPDGSMKESAGSDGPTASRRRLLGLLFEALRREEVSPAWAREAMELSGMTQEEIAEALEVAGVHAAVHGAVLPEGA